ncbi:MAG: recombinase family protein [Oscillospiraceae bacterium]|nr:recombinase family protein [Oscillospiraceae bacterium]
MSNPNRDVRIAAAYIRVSTDDQLEYSPDSQLQIIRDYAAKNGYILPDEYIFTEEEGRSGRSAVRREKFQQLIALAKSPDHPFDAILLWKFSRFARNQEEAIVYKSRLQKNGVSVVSISEPLPEGPFGSLIERIIEWEDEYYSINLAQEVRRGMTEKARRGQLQSTPSYGYRVENNLLLPVEEEAEYVREIFRRFAAGEGLFPIAKWLNASGQRTHRGNLFENRTVEYILRNPVYIGKLRWTPTGRARRNFDHPDTMIVDAAHQPLIDNATWEAAQTQMRLVKEKWRYHGRPAGERKHWMAGIVRCASCGGTLIFSAPHYFKCNNFVRGRCLHSQHIAMETLESSLLEKLHQDMTNIGSLHYTLTQASDGTASELIAVQRQIAQTKKKLDRLREAYLGGVESVEDYKVFKDALSEQLTELTKKESDLSAGSVEKTPQLLSEKLAAALAVLDSPTATIAEKYTAADNVIARCTFDKSAGTLSITYRVIL